MNRRELLINSLRAATYSAVVACGPKLPSFPKPTETPKPKETSGFEPGSIWRLNQGPHDDPEITDNERVRYAVDIGIPEIVNANGPKSGLKYEFATVRAGKVYSISPSSGIIYIKDDEGLIWYYEHLDLNPNINLNQEVPLYTKLGTVSFRSPEGGHSTGLHVHLGILREINGKLVKQPIDGLKIGEWTIHKGRNEYEGFMINDKEEKRDADLRICFPSKVNPIPCGRNENGEIINNGIKTPIKQA